MKNPAKKFISYRGGEFSYYDKGKSESVKVQLPITFTVIDELATVKGWSDEHGGGIVSNEVHKVWQDELDIGVFKKDGDKRKRISLFKGMYSPNKEMLKSLGCKYTSSVYAEMDGELVNFQFQGAALGSWIGTNQSGTFTVSESEDKKKGAVKYKVPVFEQTDQSQDQEVVIKLSQDLALYLSDYMEKEDVKEDTKEDTKEEDGVKVEDLPF